MSIVDMSCVLQTFSFSIGMKQYGDAWRWEGQETEEKTRFDTIYTHIVIYL